METNEKSKAPIIPKPMMETLCDSAYKMVLNLKQTAEGRAALERKKAERRQK